MFPELEADAADTVLETQPTIVALLPTKPIPIGRWPAALQAGDDLRSLWLRYLAWHTCLLDDLSW